MKVLLVSDIPQWAIYHVFSCIQKYGSFDYTVLPHGHKNMKLVTRAMDAAHSNEFDVVCAGFVRMVAPKSDWVQYLDWPLHKTVTTLQSHIVPASLSCRLRITDSCVDVMRRVQRVSAVSMFLTEMGYDAGIPTYYTPNFADTEVFRPTSWPSRDKGLIIGWSGNLVNHGSKRRYEELLLPALDGLEGVRLVSNTNCSIRDREEMNAWYNQVHVQVIPSRTEGFSLGAIEAAAAGRPLITSFIGGQSQIVLPGVTGLIIEPTIRSLREAICTLRDSPGLCRSMGQSMRDYVITQHSPKIIVGLWDRFLEGAPL